MVSGESLWAISAYFNPCNYRSRKRNYRIFHEALQVPLLTVEYVQGSTPQLESCDAEILLRLPGETVLWHKERLLNIAVEHLPDDCEYVAWLDCDVVFERDDWAVEVSRMLADYQLVQLFSSAVYLSKSATARMDFDSQEIPFASLVKYLETVSPHWKQRIFQETGLSRRLKYVPGLAWAASRKTLEVCGFYDAMVMGGGDKAMSNAAYGFIEELCQAFTLNDHHKQHYKKWATRFYREVAGSVSCVDQRVYHLWHGDAKNRRYCQRHSELYSTGFDPSRDLETHSATKCWKWANQNPALQELVENHFVLRHEDGIHSR